jgi:hypothetical protein
MPALMTGRGSIGFLVPIHCPLAVAIEPHVGTGRFEPVGYREHMQQSLQPDIR